MTEVTRLIEYMEVICDRPYTRDEHHIISQNELVAVYDEFESLLSMVEDAKVKASQRRLKNDKLSAFIEQYAIQLYDYAYRIKSAQDSRNPDANEQAFFYRGVNNASYLIAPGIYRKGEKHDENFYFNEISVRCPQIFRTLTNVEKLTYMQHYGCPTRLLDITTNPLVALYFACVGEDDSNGMVYIFSVNKRDVRYAGSDRVQMLATLAEFRASEQERLWCAAYESVMEDKFPQSSHSKYKEKELEQYYHAIKRHNSAFEREIIPLDLLTPQFVQPNKDNPRILKQDGAFIISGLEASDKESDNKMRKFLVKEIVIPKESKGQLRKELEYVGINQASLFPEVDKVADYLRKMA